MSFPTQTPSSYGSFQAQFPAYAPPAQGHYNASYSPQLPSTPYSFNYLTPGRSSPPAPDVPDFSSVDADVASRVMQRLVSAQLRTEGFLSAEPAALARIEQEVVALVTRLFERAHEYANLANRAGPIGTDLLLACDERGLGTQGLRRAAVGRPKRKRKDAVPMGPIAPTTLLPPPSRSPSPELLPSDDEDNPSTLPATLRTLPEPLPDLPPKHTYLRTPISPPKKAALPSLEKKLKNAGLVQGSLKNLLLATEDMTGQEDGELLGHIVNHEVTTHPRKRWKVGN